MNSSLKCPQCGAENRVGAKFCVKCGHNFANGMPANASAPMPSPTPAVTPPSQRLASTTRPITSEAPANGAARPPGRKGSGILDKVRQFLTPGEPLPPQPTTFTGGFLQPQVVYQRYSDPKQGIIVPVANYFRVQKQSAQGYYLMREVTGAPIDEAKARTLASLSAELSSVNVRKMHDVIRLPDGRTFLVIDLPEHENWHALSVVPHENPYTPENAIVWGQQIGRALAGLHRMGYALGDRHSTALGKILIDGDMASLADLSSCIPLPEDEAQKRQVVTSDTFLLARALYWIVARRNLAKDTQDLGKDLRLPRPLRVAITWGVKNSYVSMPEMLAHLSGRNLPPLRLTSGKATHPGRVRDHNEDQYFVYEVSKGRSDQPLPAFYMVADGLGGHEAGEVASDTISSSLKAWLDEYSNRKSGRATQRLGEQPADALQAAIQNANEAVFKQAQHKHNNMGATVTAALIVGEQAFVANVGDSRTYRLRGGELKAITADHSLVFSLYRAGQIPYDEIYTHPQRNQIFRNLGDKPNVEVDVFTETLESGDVLLLCSDGLWEMTHDPSIKDILRNARTPQDAADRLIEAANRGGGEDNITAVVVWVE